MSLEILALLGQQARRELLERRVVQVQRACLYLTGMRGNRVFLGLWVLREKLGQRGLRVQLA